MKIKVMSGFTNTETQSVDEVLVEDGATAGKVVLIATGKTDPSSVCVRVNGATVGFNTVLHDGDTVFISPLKVPGA